MRKRLLLHLLMGVIAVGSALAVAAFLIYTLILRTSFKADALEMNEAFRTHDTVAVSCGGLSYQAPPGENEYYNMFLLNRNTAVFSRKAVPETDDTILIDFGPEKLSYTGMEDGTAIALCWKTAEKEKHYIVRSQMTFAQMNAYFMNSYRKAS